MGTPVTENRYVAGIDAGRPAVFDVLTGRIILYPTVDHAAADARVLSGAWNLARAVLDPPGGGLRRAS